jgi:hypothetical protein
MTKSYQTYLRVHRGEESDTEDLNANMADGYDLQSLMDAFAEATGWRICMKESAVEKRSYFSAGITQSDHWSGGSRRMRLVSDATLDGALEIDENELVSSEQAASNLLEHIDRLVQSLRDAEKSIQAQEAQLASTIGLSIRAEESEVLASRMQECLQRAAMQTASDAAAVYLLDDNTSELKLRSTFGLPTQALTQPARPLRGALADLEALMGNAVLIENTALAPEWNCPENFRAALCLPIGSPHAPHGTLWLWSDQIRDFSTLDIEAAKAAADMILADIQRCVLTDEVLRTRELNRSNEAASLLQSARMPTAEPLHRDYQIAGWTFQGATLGGNFHSWTLNRFGEIIAALGDSQVDGAAGAIVASTVQSVVEAIWNVRHDPKQLLRKTNDLLWAIPDGDWRCSLGYFQLDPNSGSGLLGIAGSIQAFIVNARGYRILGTTETFLGEQPDTTFKMESIRLEGGDLLVMASADLLSGLLHGGFAQTTFLNTIRQMQEEPVQDIVDHLARTLPMNPSQGSAGPDRSLLILRREF